MQTLAMINRKGGVSKTTSTVNLAAEFSHRGRRVLTVDCDPQATLTLVGGYRPEDLEPEESLLSVMVPERAKPDFERLSQPAPWGGDLWRASPDLAGAEVALVSGEAAGPHQRLGRALHHVADQYDLVLIDSPPSIGKLVLNALCAADYLLVPVSCDFASAGGLKRMFQTVAKVREYEKPELQVLGVFGTQKRRTLHAEETLRGLAAQTGDLMMEATIPQSVAVQDAQTAHLSVRQFDPKGKATKGYRKLADEVEQRLAAASATAVAA